MKRFFIIAILCLSCFSLAFADAGKDEEISVADVAALMKEKGNKTIIIDVRTPAEFAGGHLKNARNMDFFGPRFEKEITALPADAEIIVYCKTGKRAAGARDVLAKEGYKNVKVMKGGFAAWKKSDRPVVKDDQPPK